jgi:hypothetical protein
MGVTSFRWLRCRRRSRSAPLGVSFGGMPDRYNALQIDGSNNRDLYGTIPTAIGTPGGLRAFVPEALDEIQVSAAPFDVRYGNFAGGLVNV